MTRTEFLEQTKHALIVSCQAQPGEPLYMEDGSIMYLMARAAKRAGAAAIRTESIRDVVAIKEETSLPVIGLIKVHYDGYDMYITPTMKEVDALVAAHADVVAVDATLRSRGDGLTSGEYLRNIKEKYPDLLLMADISTFEEGKNAFENGADLLSTTMSGYTPYSPQISGPDFELMRKLSSQLSIPVIGEGRIHTPEEAKEALLCGVHAVIVGGAITRPMEIAKRFIEKINERTVLY